MNDYMNKISYKFSPFKFKIGDIVSVDCHISTLNPDNGNNDVILDFGDIVRIDKINRDAISDYTLISVFNFRINKSVQIQGNPRIKQIFNENDLPYLLFKEQ